MHFHEVKFLEVVDDFQMFAIFLWTRRCKSAVLRGLLQVLVLVRENERHVVLVLDEDDVLTLVLVFAHDG